MSYPVSLPVDGKRIVVVGGGEVALRKVRGLLAAGAEVTVVSPEAHDAIRGLAASQTIEWKVKRYEPGDLNGAFLVFAATPERATNTAISQECAARHTPVNVADDPGLCTFTLPAVVRRGDLTIAIATSGRCPALARALREELEERYDSRIGDTLALLGKLRDKMVAAGWESARIGEVLSGLYRDGVTRFVTEGDADALAAFLRPRLGEDFPLPL